MLSTPLSVPLKDAWIRQGLGLQYATQKKRSSLSLRTKAIPNALPLAAENLFLLLSLDVPIFILVTSYIGIEQFTVTPGFQAYLIPTPQLRLIVVFQMRKLSLQTTKGLI